MPPPEKALRFLEPRATRSRPRPGRRGVIGTPARCARASRRLRGDYGADEVIVVTITYDHEARRRSYELIADAFELGRAAEGAAGDRVAAPAQVARPDDA